MPEPRRVLAPAGDSSASSRPLRARLLWLAVGACALLAAVPAIFLFSGGFASAEPQPASYWSQRITACQDKSLTTTDKILEHSYDCMRASIRDAVYSESFAAWVEAAQPIMAEDIMFEYACHLPGHDLGPELDAYFDGDFRRAIMALGHDICGGGVVHGIFDVWGKSQHSPEAWAEISQACVDQTMIQYNSCADAIGHAAYESMGQDLAAALAICDKVPEMRSRISCANGSYMQAYYPQSSELKLTRNPDIPPWEDMVAFCDTLSFTHTDTADGCYAGAGWAIGNTIYFNLGEMNSTGNEFLSTPEMDREALRQVDQAVAACEVNVAAGLNKGNPKICIDLVLVRMPLFWYMDTDKFVSFCEQSSRGRPEWFLESCLAGALEHVTPQAMAEVMSRYPGVADVLDSRSPDSYKVRLAREAGGAAAQPSSSPVAPAGSLAQ